jgi:hypothetical protein
MKLTNLLAATAAVALLAGCADGPGYGYYGPRGDIEYDGYYDGGYGAIYDGYWRGDSFYYRDADGHPFQRDAAHHFARKAAPGYNHIHGTAHVSHATGGEHGGGEHH